MVETLEDAVEEYLDVRRGDLAFMSHRNVAYTLRRLADLVGNIKVAEFSEKDYDRWRKALPPMSVGSLRTELARVRFFSAWCHRHGYSESDPLVYVDLPRPPRGMPRELDGGQVEKALAGLPDARAELIVSLMLMEGLRAGEVVRLECGDVDKRNRRLHVVGKGGHERIVALSATTLRAIDRYEQTTRAGAGPLIQSRRKGRGEGEAVRSSYISQMVTGWLKDAGVKVKSRDGVSAHAFRHTAAGELLDTGVDIRQVQEFLGHTNLATTSIYLRRHPNLEVQAEAQAERDRLRGA